MPCSGAIPGWSSYLLLHAVYGEEELSGGDTFCCNGNFRLCGCRTAAEGVLPQPGRAIALNLFTRSDKTFDVNGKTVEIKAETSYPNSGEVKLTFTCSEPVEFAFRFRTPALGGED